MLAVPADLCIEARWVVPMTARGMLLAHHTLGVRHGRILDILPHAMAREHYAPIAALQRSSHLLMPGMINTQTHAALSLFRAIAADSAPRGWFDPRTASRERRFVSPEFARDGVMLTLAEMLRSGITCFADRYYFPSETAATASDQGMRAVIGLPVTETELPTRALTVRDAYRGHSLISTRFAPQEACMMSDAMLSRIATLADELDAGIIVDLHRSRDEIAVCLARYGLRPIERLSNLGLLTPALLALNMAHSSASDIELAARSGLSISLCPNLCLKHGQGLPPVVAIADAGIRIALGSGGEAHERQDIWDQMRMLALMLHDTSSGARGDTAWDALAAATRGGAAALGLDNDVGTLEAGKWADVCCVDLSGAATQPLGAPLVQLMFGAGRDSVSDVWVAGRQLLSSGELTRLDWPAVAERARVWARRLNEEE